MLSCINLNRFKPWKFWDILRGSWIFLNGQFNPFVPRYYPNLGGKRVLGFSVLKHRNLKFVFVIGNLIFVIPRRHFVGVFVLCEFVSVNWYASLLIFKNIGGVFLVNLKGWRSFPAAWRIVKLRIGHFALLKGFVEFTLSHWGHPSTSVLVYYRSFFSRHFSSWLIPLRLLALLHLNERFQRWFTLFVFIPILVPVEENFPRFKPQLFGGASRVERLKLLLTVLKLLYVHIVVVVDLRESHFDLVLQAIIILLERLMPLIQLLHIVFPRWYVDGLVLTGPHLGLRRRQVLQFHVQFGLANKVHVFGCMEFWFRRRFLNGGVVETLVLFALNRHVWLYCGIWLPRDLKIF